MIDHYFLGPRHHSQECKVFLAEGLTEGESSLESNKPQKTVKIIKEKPQSKGLLPDDIDE